MWILPKQLHTSAYVLDTAALISDLDEQSQICEPSLLARSKPSLARTWSQRWKRDCWTQHLSGRILKPFHGQSFVIAWTSSLEVILASHSQQQANDLEQKIQDTSGHLSQPELFPCDQESASSRTSKDTSALDSERSLANWKALVTRLRGEYSQRVKLGPLINASESSSWPTCAARDYKGESGSGRQERKGNPADTLPNAVAQQHGQAVPVNPSTDGNRQESWATPSTMDHINVVRNPEERTPAANKGGCKNLREEVHQWATPNTMDYMECRSAEGVIKIATGARKCRSMPSNLREQVDPQTVGIYQKTKEESWATPRTGATDNSRPNNKGGIPLGDQARRAEPTMNSAKLNPRWVETLMGLPIGWVMPSCVSPLTIAPTNCDCLATELYQLPQPELF